MKLRLAVAAAVAAVLAAPGFAATKLYSSGRLSLPIQSDRTTEHTIPLREPGPVSHVGVWVRLEDSRLADLQLSLRAPDGTVVPLLAHRGGAARNLGAGRGCTGSFAVFDDEDATPAAESEPPYIGGSVRPEAPLGVLNGKQARGGWTLRIAVTGTGNLGRLLCWQLDLSRDVLERRRASAGAVEAELSFREREYAYRDVRLRIRRRGKTVLDAPAPKLRCGPTCPGWTPGEVRVRDLDRDGEPEVLADFFTGGAHCCTYSAIYRWRGDRYRRGTSWWGNVGYRIRDVDRDGRPELVSADDRFAYEFTAYASSIPPLRIWRYDDGRLDDVTRRFPTAVRADARRLYRLYLSARRSSFPEVRGVLAAYQAELDLLGRGDEGWRLLDRALVRGELGRGPSKDGYPAGRAYLARLRVFLLRLGYER